MYELRIRDGRVVAVAHLYDNKHTCSDWDCTRNADYLVRGIQIDAEDNKIVLDTDSQCFCERHL